MSSGWKQVFAMIDKKPQGKTCAAIVGITDEGAEIMEEYKGSPAHRRGPARRCAGGRALRDHRATARLRTWAEELGLDDAVTLLQETLDEEEATDEALTELCGGRRQSGSSKRTKKKAA